MLVSAFRFWPTSATIGKSTDCFEPTAWECALCMYIRYAHDAPRLGATAGRCSGPLWRLYQVMRCPKAQGAPSK
eukprot:6182611-Pleurochrysis_carterae.AAC.4